MSYRKKISRRKNRKNFRKGLKSRRKNYSNGYLKRGGMRF